MKKIILFLALALTSHVSFCQNTYPWPSSGSVGIGTTTPLAPLDVKLTTNQHIQFVPDLNGGFPGFSGLVCINDNNSNYTPLGLWASKYFIGGGNVGIGTSTPEAKLEVNGDGKYNGALQISGAGVNSNTTKVLIANGYGNGKNWALSAGANAISEEGFHIYNWTDSTSSPMFSISNNGNISIGTIDPHNYKLAVNGNIIAEEIKVKLHANWPDYVFKRTYRLLPLDQLKSYIDQNHHLPEMLSADEVEKNGVNLGEMVKLQTKKIEELTLYMIEKDNEIKKLKEQQKQIDQLKQMVETLSKEIHK